MLLNFCNMHRAFKTLQEFPGADKGPLGSDEANNSARPHRRDGFESSETPARHQLVIDQSNISCFIFGDSPTCACMCVCATQTELGVKQGICTAECAQMSHTVYITLLTSNRAKLGDL